VTSNLVGATRSDEPSMSDKRLRRACLPVPVEAVARKIYFMREQRVIA